MEKFKFRPLVAATLLGLCTMQAQAAIEENTSASGVWPAQEVGVLTYQLDQSLYLPTGKIRLGQMDFELSQSEIDEVAAKYKSQGQEVVDQQVRILKLKRLVWLAPYSFQIPNERAHWAMAMAHAASLFKNVTGIDDPYHDANLYAAKSLQEAGMGADYANVPGYFTYPVLPKYQDVDANQPEIRGIWNTLRGGRTKHDGFFQLEGHMYSAYGELMRMFPNRFYKGLAPTDDYHAVAPAEKTSPIYNQVFKPEPGKNSFVASAIGASYYNIFAYYTVARSADEFGLFAQEAKDRQALTKIISVGYNRGLSKESMAMFPLKPVRREACMQKESIDSCFDLAGDGSGGFGVNYLYQVPYKAKALKEVAETGVAGYPGYYTSDIDWASISSYLDTLAPLYTTAELTAAEDAAATVFNKISTQGSIDFADQFGDVLDAIILALPVDTPWSQLCDKDGSSYDAFDRMGTFKGQESTYKCLPESVAKPLYLGETGTVPPVKPSIKPIEPVNPIAWKMGEIYANGTLVSNQGLCFTAQHDPGVWEEPLAGGNWFWLVASCGDIIITPTPVVTPPAVTPPVVTPPVVTPPVVTPPVVTPPVVTPPVVTQPVVTPPVVTPPPVTPEEVPVWKTESYANGTLVSHNGLCFTAQNNPGIWERPKAGGTWFWAEAECSDVVTTPPSVIPPIVTPPVIILPIVTPPVVTPPKDVIEWQSGVTKVENGSMVTFQGSCFVAQHNPGVWEQPAKGGNWFWLPASC